MFFFIFIFSSSCTCQIFLLHSNQLGKSNMLVLFWCEIQTKSMEQSDSIYWTSVSISQTLKKWHRESASVCAHLIFYILLSSKHTTTTYNCMQKTISLFHFFLQKNYFSLYGHLPKVFLMTLFYIQDGCHGF